MTTARIAPSILSADFVNFEADFATIASADLIHVDVMDNHFVPNLTFGQQMVARLQQVTPLPLDLHLMIEDPERWAPDFAETGAYSVTFHAEARLNCHYEQHVKLRQNLEVRLDVGTRLDCDTGSRTDFT